jgi:hypothetical protein
MPDTRLYLSIFITFSIIFSNYFTFAHNFATYICCTNTSPGSPSSRTNCLASFPVTKYHQFLVFWFQQWLKMPIYIVYYRVIISVAHIDFIVSWLQVVATSSIHIVLFISSSSKYKRRSLKYFKAPRPSIPIWIMHDISSYTHKMYNCLLVRCLYIDEFQIAKRFLRRHTFDFAIEPPVIEPAAT